MRTCGRLVWAGRKLQPHVHEIVINSILLYVGDLTVDTFRFKYQTQKARVKKRKADNFKQVVSVVIF